jgi:quercetin dioxygenase-like cupin family protein
MFGAMTAGAQTAPVVEPLSRGTFFDSQVAVTVREKGIANTEVTHLADASDVVVLRITIAPGGSAGWHTHTGTGFLVNIGPGTLTNVIGDDCIRREHYPGHAFLDPGHGDVHAARNLSDEDVVLIATFVGVQGAPVTPVTGPDFCNFL